MSTLQVSQLSLYFQASNRMQEGALDAAQEVILREAQLALTTDEWDKVLEKINDMEVLSENLEIVEESRFRLLKLISARRTGDTVGHYAARANRSDVLHALLNKKANLRQRNHRNVDVLDEVSRTRDALKRAAMSDPHAADFATTFEELHDQISLRCFTAPERLFMGSSDLPTMQREFQRSPEDIDAPLTRFGGITWLAICVEETKLEEVQWLLNKGANASVMDTAHSGLLHMLSLGGTQDGLITPDEDVSWNSDEESDEDATYKAVDRVSTSSAYMQDQEWFCFRQDPTLLEAEKRALEVLAVLLQHKVSPEHRNLLSDTPNLYFAETAPQPASYVWAAKMLIGIGEAKTISESNMDSEMSAIAIMAQRFGNGPWLDYLLSQGNRRDSKLDLIIKNHCDVKDAYYNDRRGAIEGHHYSECENHSHPHEAKLLPL